ncbi:MAG: DUF2892 domain-containing protein [Candidatus Woesearchaeota archaeon]
MKQNLGKLDRILRFILALWLLGPLAPRFWHCGWANMLIVIIGIIALVESFIGWCPMMDWLKIDNTKQ